MIRKFPDGFLFGAATASYQIEGAVAEGGRTPSCWDTFVKRAGVIRNGDTGIRSCDSYHRLEEDLDLIAELGLGSYRFSISWSRVLPEGTGRVNQAGIDHYERLVDGLVARGVAPAVTAFHWDLPQALQDRGGWANRECASWFSEYCSVLGDVLGDRVAHWITLNEPAVVANRGYRDGSHAPGICDPRQASAATHHLLLAHGLGTLALRRSAGPEASVGITLDPMYVVALDPADADLASEIAAAKMDLYLSPVLGEGYPTMRRTELLPDPSIIAEGDMERISTPIDFLGINYYDPIFVRRRGEVLGRGEFAFPGYPDAVSVKPDGYELTSMGWIVDPHSFHALLCELKSRAPTIPLIITENGRATQDYVDPEGRVRDPERISYLYRHLAVLHRAISEGVDVRGYFVWSLLDNFEWTDGYSQRLGLVWVDFDSGRRLVKESGRYYQRIIACRTLDEESPI